MINDVLKTRYQCSAQDAFRAYGIALLVGSWLTVLAMWAGSAANGPVANIPEAIFALPSWLLLALPTAAIMFWVPGLALSIPLFLLLHLLRLREWPFLTVAGAVLVFVVNHALIHDPAVWVMPSQIGHATIMGIIGGVTGLALWATAYRGTNWAKLRIPVAFFTGMLVVTTIAMII